MKQERIEKLNKIFENLELILNACILKTKVMLKKLLLILMMHK